MLLWSVAGIQPAASAEEDSASQKRILEYRTEAQGSFSSGSTPLWLNANKYGLSSLESVNGYMRASVASQPDKRKKWDYGYGVDVVLPYHYTSDFVVQQLYAEMRFLHGVLTVGSKEYPAELKDNALSSGSQTLGINARPVPQIRVALPEYWTVPLLKGWLHLKGHLAYGRYTDDRWQHQWTSRQHSYTDHVLYHSKACYLKIGKREKSPLSLELGIETATQFGGVSHVYDQYGNYARYKNKSNLGAYWDALLFQGNDVYEDIYKNAGGNTVGSWLARVNYENDKTAVRIYADHFFEDHSGLFFLCKGGYGKDGDWNKRSANHMVGYALKDIMLGADVELKNNRWLNHIVLEYLYTKYQSGPLYHEHGQQIYDQISGRDDYYNNYLYPGWQHWGQVVGNPLYRSLLYNNTGTVDCRNNRFQALHLGVSGSVLENLHYKLLATYQQSFGTYNYPVSRPQDNFYGMLELDYAFKGKLKGWEIRNAWGLDAGKTLGDNRGVQLSIIKKGVISY